MLATFDCPLEQFTLFDGEGQPIAEIVLFRRGLGCGYRAVFFQGAGMESVLVSHFAGLLPAVKATHTRVVSSYAHQGGPIAHWG